MKEYFQKIYKGSQKEFYSLAEKNLIDEKKMFVITANPETLMIAEENEILKNALLDDQTIIVPDGIGIVKGAQMFEIKEINKTITGIDFVNYLLEKCNEHKKSIFLFGAKKEVIEKFTQKIDEQYPDLVIAGAVDGYVENKQEIFEKIKKAKPDVVLVALGIPNQEILIYENLKDFNKGIFVGVGGSFDVLSGMKKRAPKMFLKYHLEWLYRITVEPKRIKRFLQSNVRYIKIIKKERKQLQGKE